MSFDKFIQTRTIARAKTFQGQNLTARFPRYVLDSFIEFETDGYLVGVHFMLSHNNNITDEDIIEPALPNGAIVAKVSGDVLSLPPGGDTTNYSGAGILISSLEMPNGTGAPPENDRNAGSRQTTIAYDADSKRIPIKSNDRLGVYLCTNSANGDVYFRYTLTAYFVRS
jgi:hypothetical protein